MTNEQIILAERIRLMEAGKIGVVRETVAENGRIIREPDEIHDYDTWKKLGQQVRKGSKAIVRLYLRNGRKSKRMVSFFCRAQCETIWS